MKYFSYGSNMNPDRMNSRMIYYSKREHGILIGWKLKFNKISNNNYNIGYANIEQDESGIVEGILYKIKDSDLKKLDIYEGCPNHYYHKQVKIKLDDEQIVEATTYIAQPSKIKNGLKPSKEYLRHLLKGNDFITIDYYKKLKYLDTIE